MGNSERRSRSGRRPPPEAELQTVLRELVGRFPVPGLDIRLSDARVKRRLSAAWHGHRQRYAYGYMPSSTPRAIEAAMNQAMKHARPPGIRPLVIAPYLSESRLEELAGQEVSGLDLCGNCVLVSDGFVTWRSGNANRFSESRPIKNIFRGNSSIFARCFVLRPGFESLTALREFARRRPGVADGAGAEAGLTLGTASKVVRALEEHFLVRREGKALHVLDAEELMGALLAEYRPQAGRRVAGNAANLPILFERDPCGRARFRSVITGLGSASHYGILSAPDMLSVYVADLDAAAAVVGLQETRVFPKLELIEERAEAVYFDARPAGGLVWASPVQTWLELARGGPREREAAEALARALRAGQVGDE